MRQGVFKDIERKEEKQLIKNSADKSQAPVNGTKQ